jgi:CMP-N,N'-diacetyllegionaminic acid synthase
MTILYLIPARAGSKGLPGKNSKLLLGKPLIAYSIELALKVLEKGDEICISTNDIDIVPIAKKYQLELPFIRPENLSSDTAGSREVIIHALKHYRSTQKEFDAVLLLQPTSPIRSVDDINAVKHLFINNKPDMVVSVRESKDNPYFNLFELDESGFLIASKSPSCLRRQDCPPVYAYNGSLYLISTSTIEQQNFMDFKQILKYEMPEEKSVDIDTMKDWLLAEYYLNIN